MRGKVRYCVFVNKTLNGVLKFLDAWCKHFDSWIFSDKWRRELCVSLLIVKRFVKYIQPESLSKTSCSLAAFHIYSDAASSEDETRIGGCDGAVAWTLKIDKKKLPAWIVAAKPDIQFFEILAADISLRRLGKKSRHNLAHVDNLSDCYCLTGGSSNSILVQSCVAEILQRIYWAGWSVYWAWISTKRNPGDCTTRLEKLDILLKFFPSMSFTELDQSYLDPILLEYKHSFCNFNRLFGEIPTKPKKRPISSSRSLASKKLRIQKRPPS